MFLVHLWDRKRALSTPHSSAFLSASSSLVLYPLEAPLASESPQCFRILKMASSFYSLYSVPRSSCKIHCLCHHRCYGDLQTSLRLLFVRCIACPESCENCCLTCMLNGMMFEVSMTNSAHSMGYHVKEGQPTISQSQELKPKHCREKRSTVFYLVHTDCYEML